MMFMPRKYILFLLLLLTFVLTGCFYPSELKVENQIPYPEQIANVEQAVLRFQQDTGVLPIVTKEEDTPLYEKYVIDFSQLIPRYLPTPPGNSFSEGGPFIYVLIDVEEAPQVRLLDLRITEEVRKLQFRVNEYLNKHTYLPIAELLSNGYFTLDYEQLNLKNPPLVQSIFSNEYLPFVVNNQGKVGIDYRLDVYQAMQSKDTAFEEGIDLRYLLAEESFFVPAHSFPIVLDNGQLLFK